MASTELGLHMGPSSVGQTLCASHSVESGACVGNTSLLTLWGILLFMICWW